MAFKTEKTSIKKANKTITDQWGKASNDPYRPVYHPIAPHGWMNDPNGLIYDKGWYHLFYQWNPYGASWGNIHWGHMRTKDFATWEHLSTALAPEEDYEKDGCFSGSAVMQGDTMVLAYTANVFKSGNHPHNEGPMAVQMQATASSADGIQFEKSLNNPVIDEVPANGTLVDFRDPKVWLDDDQWYMVLGIRKDDKGEIVQYKSKDLMDWHVDSTLFSPKDLGYMLECPDYFKINEKEVLLFSPMGVEGYYGPHVSGYLIRNTEFDEKQFKLADYGPRFYAPQTFEGSGHDRIMIGWIQMPELDSNQHSWCGCLSLPRKLDVSPSNHLLSLPYKGMHLKMNPVKEMKKSVLNPREIIRFEGDHHRISLKISSLAEQEIIIRIKGDGKGLNYTDLLIDSYNKLVLLDWSMSGVSQTHSHDQQQSVYDYNHISALDEMSFDIYIDKSVVEFYGLEGHLAMTASILSDPLNKNGQIFCRNQSVFIEELVIYEIEASEHLLCLEE